MESTLAQDAGWSVERCYNANCGVTTMVRLWPVSGGRKATLNRHPRRPKGDVAQPLHVAVARRSVLDEGHGVTRVLFLLLDRLLFLRCVLWLLLVFFRGLMRHRSLLWIAGIMAPYDYKPMSRGAQA